MRQIWRMRHRLPPPAIDILYIFDKKTVDGNEKMWPCERKDQQCMTRLHTDAFSGEFVRVVDIRTQTGMLLEWR